MNCARFKLLLFVTNDQALNNPNINITVPKMQHALLFVLKINNLIFHFNLIVYYYRL